MTKEKKKWSDFDNEDFCTIQSFLDNSKIMKHFFSSKQFGSAFYQYVSAATVSFMIVSSGMHYGWSSPSLEKLQLDDSPVKITNSEGSWLAVMTMIGNILGSALVSVIMDNLGRKRAIMLSGPLFFISWIMIALSRSVEVLYLARFIAGVTDSLLWVGCTMYTAEISEPTIRGLLVSSMPVTWIFGILLINTTGSFLSIYATALVSSILPVFSLISFCWMPESPYALLMKSDYEGAKKSLQLFRGSDNVDSELIRMNFAIQSQMSNTGKYLDLITVKSNRKAVIIILILRGAQLFSGASAIIFYTQTIFREAGGSISPAIASMIYVSVQLILCSFASSIVDRAGRRPLLIISITGSAIALFTEGTYFFLKTHTDLDMDNYSYIALIALIAYVITFSLGMQTIPLLMLGELFPANVKAFALCAADIYFSLMAITASKFFQIMKDNYGMHVPFYSFTAICLIGLVFIYAKVPETKGKTLEEIQINLNGDK